MANEKLDWFPIYWQRFIIGTLEMNAEEIGAYILLIIHQWDKGFVPEDHKELKRISKVSVRKLEKVLQKFEKIDGKYYNDTVEIIRIEQTEKHEKNHAKAIKGAKARWDKHKLSIAQALPKHCLDDAIREEESRVEEIRIEESREEQISPELNFQYMIGGKEVLSVEETFKENFPVLFTNFQIKHGDLKIKKWLAGFSDLHKQKSWKDIQDLRAHIANYINIQSEKDNGATKKLNPGQPKDGKIKPFGSY